MKTIKLTITLSTLCILGTLSLGCQGSGLEKSQKIIDKAVKKCAESKETFAKMELFDGRKEFVLTEACKLPVGKITIKDKLYGSVTQGPYTWRTGISAQDVWVLTGVDWNTLAKAKRIIGDKEAKMDDLRLAEKHLGEAQKAVPKSSWIRVNRFENLLRIRAVERRKSKTPVLTLGNDVSTYYKSIGTWATDNDKEAGVRATFGVVKYYKKYLGIMQSNLASLGSQDEWLQTSIADAEKNKDAASLEKYKKELEDRLAKRPAVKKQIEENITKLKSSMCVEMVKLNTNDVKDEKLVERIKGIKTSVNCS